MAFEHTLYLETELPYPFICADGTGIEQGTLLKMTDPITASASDGASDNIAGVAAKEKIASSGVTTIPVYRGGWFKATLSGSCTVGDVLVTVGADNQVKVPTGSLSGSKALGIALETGTTGQTILYELRPGFYPGSPAPQ